MAEIETLVDDIYKLLSTQTYNLDVSYNLSDDLNYNPRNLRLSKIGTNCTRKLWYQFAGTVGEVLQDHVRVKFAMGHMLEALVLDLAVAAGHDVKDRQLEVDVAGVKGHIDAVVDDVLIDAKSVTKYGFAKMTSGGVYNDDPFGYVMQLQAYKQALGVERAAWLLIQKESGELKLVFLEDLDLDVDSRIAMLKKLRAAAAKGRGCPERSFMDVPDGASGNRKLGLTCSYCEFKRVCWPELRTFAYSTGPVFLTHVEKLPKVSEICG